MSEPIQSPQQVVSVSEAEKYALRSHDELCPEYLMGLYRLSRIVEIPGVQLDEVLNIVPDILIGAMQFPKIAGARFSIGEKEFQTPNFVDNGQKLLKRVIVNDRPYGTLEISYQHQLPVRDEGPFLNSEREFINAVSERVGRIIERLQSVQLLSETYYILESKYNARGIKLERAQENLFHAVRKRLQAEKKLNRQEERIQWMADSFPADFLVLTPTYDISYANDRFRRHFPEFAENIINCPVKRVIGEEQFQRSLHYIEEARKGRNVQFDIPVKLQNGMLRHYQVYVRPEMNPHNTLESFYVIILNVTRFKSDKVEIRSDRKKLKQIKDTASRLSRFSLDDNVFPFITEQFHRTVGEFGVTVLLGIEETEYTLRCMMGLGTFREDVKDLLKLTKFRNKGQISELQNQACLSGKVFECDNDLHTITNGVISDVIANRLKKLLKTDRIMGIGLTRNGQLFGIALFLLPGQNPTFDRILLETLAKQISIALEKHFFWLQLKRKTTGIEKLLASGREISDSLDFDRMMEVTIREAISLFELDGGAVYIIDRSGKELIPMSNQTLSGSDASFSGRLSVENSSLGQIMRSRKCRIINNLNTKVGLIQAYETVACRGNHLMVVPVLHRTVLLGVMCFSRLEQPFSGESLNLAELFASHIGMSISNARSFHSLQKALEQKQLAEMRYSRQSEMMRVLIAQSQDAVMFLNNDIVIECNPQTLKLLGRSESEILQQPLHSLAPEYQTGGRLSETVVLNRIAAALSDVAQEFEWLTADSSGRPFQTRAFLCKYKISDNIKLILRLRPIDSTVRNGDVENSEEENDVHSSNEKLVTERREQTIIGYEDKLAAMNNMATGIAHELSQPLAIIHAQAEFLKLALGHVPGTHHRFADNILDQVHRASTVIQQMQNLTYRGESQSGISRFHEEIENILLLFQQRLRDQDIQVECKSDKQIPCVILSSAQCQQILSALLTNAIQAIREKQQTEDNPANSRIVIELTASPDLSDILFWMHDNGIGMSEETLEHCFEPFFTTRDVGDGQGLGLSVVYQMIRNTGGSVKVQSQYGEGTKISLQIPAAD